MYWLPITQWKLAISRFINKVADRNFAILCNMKMHCTNKAPDAAACWPRARHFSTGPYPATTIKMKSENTGENAFSISSRFVTSFPACILRTSATALRALYGIVRRICRTLINQTGADRWHILSVPQIITPVRRGRGGENKERYKIQIRTLFLAL